MNIILYRNLTPINRINRNLSQIASITGEPRTACDLLDPEIELNYNDSYLNANYAYIPAFKRYYYYSKPPTIEGKIITLHLHVDVLYTYKDIVNASQCIAQRSSTNYNLYLEDPALYFESGNIYYNRTIPGGYAFEPDAGRYILSTAGA